MNTKLYAVVGISAIVLGGAFVVKQSNDISKKASKIEVLTDENVGLKKDLDKEVNLTEVLTAENESLKEQILELTSKIDNLTIKIIDLEKKLKTYKGKINRREKKIADYKKQIAALSKNRDANRQEIKKLEAEKAKVVKQYEELLDQAGQTKDKIKEDSAAKMREEIERINLKRIAQITDETMVEFKKFTVAKKRRGNVLKDIKVGTDKWKYTMIELNLDHPRFDLLLEKDFLVQIYDIDSGKPLSINDKDGKFPNSQNNKVGASFKYDGNLVYIPYFNEEVKTGKNYEIRTYYLDAAGKKHIMKKGVITLVRDGVPLAL